MSEHFEDGRVLAVDKRTGQKRRVMPHIIASSKNLSLAPTERARGKSVKKLTEPRRSRPRQVTEPATTSPEPDSPESVTEPVTSTDNEESDNA